MEKVKCRNCKNCNNIRKSTEKFESIYKKINACTVKTYDNTWYTDKEKTCSDYEPKEPDEIRCRGCAHCGRIHKGTLDAKDYNECNAQKINHWDTDRVRECGTFERKEVARFEWRCSECSRVMTLEERQEDNYNGYDIIARCKCGGRVKSFRLDAPDVQEPEEIFYGAPMSYINELKSYIEIPKEPEAEYVRCIDCAIRTDYWAGQDDKYSTIRCKHHREDTLRAFKDRECKHFEEETHCITCKHGQAKKEIQSCGKADGIECFRKGTWCSWEEPEPRPPESKRDCFNCRWSSNKGINKFKSITGSFACCPYVDGNNTLNYYDGNSCRSSNNYKNWQARSCGFCVHLDLNDPYNNNPNNNAYRCKNNKLHYEKDACFKCSYGFQNRSAPPPLDAEKEDCLKCKNYTDRSKACAPCYNTYLNSIKKPCGHFNKDFDVTHDQKVEIRHETYKDDGRSFEQIIKDVKGKEQETCSGCKHLNLHYDDFLPNYYECKYHKNTLDGDLKRCIAYEKWVWEEVYVPKFDVPKKEDWGKAFCRIEHKWCEHRYDFNINFHGTCTLKHGFRGVCRFKSKPTTTTLGTTLKAITGTEVGSKYFYAIHYDGANISSTWNSNPLTDPSCSVHHETVGDPTFMSADQPHYCTSCCNYISDKYKAGHGRCKAEHPTFIGALSCGCPEYNVPEEVWNTKTNEVSEVDNTTNEKDDKKEYITKEELEKLSFEEVQKRIKKVEENRNKRIRDLTWQINENLCNGDGFKKGFIKYLKSLKGFKIEWSYPIFSKEELKLIRNLRNDFSPLFFWYKIKDEKRVCDVLEKIIPYQEPYLKQQAIEEFCKLNPECYKDLAEVEKPKPKMVRPKKCQYCGVKIKKRNTCCHECGVKVELVEVIEG